MKFFRFLTCGFLVLLVCLPALGQGTAVPADLKSDPKLEKKVTVRLQNDLGVALDWLAQQEVEFVVGDDLLQSRVAISLNVLDRPLSSVMDAIAGALDAVWLTRDGIYYLKAVRGSLGQVQPITPTPAAMDTAPPTKAEIETKTPAETQVEDPDAVALIGSITAAQWKIHASRGHLKLSELSKAQRALLSTTFAKGAAIVVAAKKTLNLRLD